MLVPAYARHPLAFFIAVDAPVLFLCFHVASKALQSREISVGQRVVLVILMPVAIWAVMIFGLFGLAFFLDATLRH